jgi:cytoskeletal protein CcmA (bactofilin family)
MIDDQDFKNFHYNVFGDKSIVTGDLTLSGDSIINSQVYGNIHILEKGKLILERGSFIKGKIKAIDIEIFGTVHGEIECTGLVSIRSGAQVHGFIKSGRLVIYPGAIVEMQANSIEGA